MGIKNKWWSNFTTYLFFINLYAEMGLISRSELAKSFNVLLNRFSANTNNFNLPQISLIFPLNKYAFDFRHKLSASNDITTSLKAAIVSIRSPLNKYASF